MKFLKIIEIIFTGHAINSLPCFCGHKIKKSLTWAEAVCYCEKCGAHMSEDEFDDKLRRLRALAKKGIEK